MGLDKLGRYVIIRTLGKGAMGMVYEARDPNLDRRVAIKTIKVEHLSPQASAEYEARFRTEARSAPPPPHGAHVKGIAPEEIAPEEITPEPDMKKGRSLGCAPIPFSGGCLSPRSSASSRPWHKAWPSPRPE